MSESQTYIERLRELRANTLKTLEGLDADGLNWKPTRKDTNSIFVLATHLIGSERYWLHQVVGQRAVERDRAAEFRARGTSADALRDSFDAVARASDEVLSQLAPAEFDATRSGNYGSHSVRWCILHVIEHYSEHSGQMSLTRQLRQEQAKSGKRKAARRKPKTKGGK